MTDRSIYHQNLRIRCNIYICLLANHNPNPLATVLRGWDKSIRNHLNIRPVCLIQLPPPVFSFVLRPAKSSPDRRVHKIKLCVCELHAKALSRALREGHQVPLELRICDETFWLESVRIVKDIRVEMDQRCRHSYWCLEQQSVLYFGLDYKTCSRTPAGIRHCFFPLL